MNKQNVFKKSQLIVFIGIGLILFGLLASASTAFYELFSASEVSSVAAYAKSLTPSWQIKTSVVGLMVSTIGLLLFALSKTKITIKE
jgi:uncharacterized membrane protein